MSNYKRITCEDGRMYRIGFDGGPSWSPLLIVFPNHLANETEKQAYCLQKHQTFFSPYLCRRTR